MWWYRTFHWFGMGKRSFIYRCLNKLEIYNLQFFFGLMKTSDREISNTRDRGQEKFTKFFEYLIFSAKVAEVLLLLINRTWSDYYSTFHATMMSYFDSCYTKLYNLSSYSTEKIDKEKLFYLFHFSLTALWITSDEDESSEYFIV